MKPIDLLETIGSIRDRYVLDAHSQKAVSQKRVPPKRLVLIAAIIALMLLLVGCVVVILGLKDLKIGVFSYDVGFGETQSSDVISMQGFVGSPEYLAAKEWREYCTGYDTDHAILDKIGNGPTNLDSKYMLYNAYTQEMCDKLEEITQKYSLKLHSEINLVDREELDYRVGSAFMGDDLSRGGGYIYDDGTFQFDGDAQIGGTLISFQCRRSVKGTFDDVVLTVGNIDQYQEFTYRTKSGETVILALGPTKGLIIADFEDCFITVNVLESGGFYLTEDHLKFIADELDFSVLKHVIPPDMRGDSTEGSNINEIFSPDQQATIEWSDDPGIAACQAILMDVLQYQNLPVTRELGYDGSDMSNNRFAICDIDGDGADELILKYTTTYTAGASEIIYGISAESKRVWEEFYRYPAVTYYDNGIIKAKGSHSNGRGGDFWPYTLCQYNPNTDAYEDIATVDAWDKSVVTQDSQGNPFPEDIDLDKDGVVYYIIPYGQDDYGTPVDYAEYEKWYLSYLNGARKMQIPYQELTEENISNAASASIILSETYVSDSSVQGYSLEWVDAKEVFEEILAGERVFFSRDLCDGVTIAEYCNEANAEITKYTLTDLDDDGTPELILWETVNGIDDYGFLVIRYDGNNGAAGYSFTYRQMIDLKKDGTFGYSGGIADTGYARMVFDEDGWKYQKIGYVTEKESGVAFYWDDYEVDQDTYWKRVAIQNAKENAQWNPYPSDRYDLTMFNIP